MMWRSDTKGRAEDDYIPLEDIKEMQRGPASKDFTDVNNIVIDEDDERYDRCIGESLRKFFIHPLNIQAEICFYRSLSMVFSLQPCRCKGKLGS